MKLSPPLILRLISSLCFITTLALAISMSKPGCQEKCGNITIPYPFGIGSKCSANSNFTVICQNSTNPPTPFLSSINMEALNISMLGMVMVKLPVSPLNCSDVETTQYLATSLLGTPFTISSDYNSLAVLGYHITVILHAEEIGSIIGCRADCDANSTDTSCNGVNCCQTTIPPGLQELQYTYQSINRANTTNNSSCGYVFPVESAWFQEDYTRYKGLHNQTVNLFDQEFRYAPLVLDWEFAYSDNATCGYASSRVSYTPPGRYCSCYPGYEGNPYLPGGCSHIDECNDPTFNPCGDAICINREGYSECQYPDDNNIWSHPDENNRSRIKIAFISIGSAFGALILLLASWKSTKTIRKKIKENRKHKFFKRNGGLLLQQQLSATDNVLDKTKLFSSKELAQATDRYSENRILGRGGQGTVYKGMLTDGRIVAVKKYKRVDEGDLEAFINEVVILSQINHRNVVKLLGCCLETEVPLLVYEFILNGTLFQHIHDPNEEFPLSWEIRLRIAREIAGALSYLHSAASAPIYHRDIKSTNILLDDKYHAKVSDFGTSRSVAIDQTHLTTRVLGTFGYLDPEYFRSSQFTEKSDVYSFGVVMVELLTGEKAVTSVRAEEGKSLAIHFLHSMEENHLFEILDPRVLREGSKEDIVAVAELARRCLHLNGKKRPTMKEVAVELEGIQMLKEGSVCMQNQEDDTIDVDESSDFSSISASMHLDTMTAYSQDAHRQFLDEP
ncbi:hypothetical protein DH2020_034518 [Rehmannia glutinosa]|uniref:Protein kinase domain-containing protein n=1 Tax=Rehmannia glutinosa TaxID=99300 RepID=A0ABR0V9K2_REHGL